ncbi:MAG: hypothetical protein GWO02_06820 [Gammaproteobacteria bacterium]|nr:hypothetical protein [Gammaproteobacteria bacterium]
MKKIFLSAVAFGVIAVAVTTAWLISDIVDWDLWDWEAPAPGSIVAQSIAPGKGNVASVIAMHRKGHYRFVLSDTRSGNIIAEKQIFAPIGYHAHIVTLRWGPRASRAIAVIDHDFGKGNLKFTLSP